MSRRIWAGSLMPSRASRTTRGRTMVTTGSNTRTTRSGATDESHASGSLFATLWACAHVIHAWHQGGDAPDQPLSDPWLALVLVAALVLLGRPSSHHRLLVLAVAQLAAFAAQMPFVANHWTIAAFVNAGIIVAYVRARRTGHEDAAGCLMHLAPYARWVFLISYSAAAVAKLNATFLDPSHSCALATFEPVAQWLGAAMPAGAAAYVVTWGAAGIELIIPLMLLTPRFRAVGIALGLTFHVLLAATPVVVVMDFTAVVIALLLLFAPGDIGARLRHDAQDFARRRATLVRHLSRIGPVARPSAAMLVILLATSRAMWIGETAFAIATWTAFLIFGAVVLGAGLALLASSKHTSVPMPAAGSRPSAVHLVLVIVLVLNAASPYMGFKTTSSFTMFSNLRTEAEATNHLFLPRLAIVGYQDDLAEVRSSSNDVLQGYARAGQLITMHELRRVLSTDPEASVHYVHSAEHHHLAAAEHDPDLVGLPFLQRKLLHFRSVTPTGSPICQP